MYIRGDADGDATLARTKATRLDNVAAVVM
jgi:hypothetical protein